MLAWPIAFDRERERGNEEKDHLSEHGQSGISLIRGKRIYRMLEREREIGLFKLTYERQTPAS